MNILAFIPRYKTETHEFQPQLFRLVENKSDENGVYYKDYKDREFYQTKSMVFIAENGYLNDAYNKCSEYIDTHFNHIQSKKATTQTIALNNAYVPFYNTVSNHWMPAFVKIEKENDDTVWFKYLTDNYSIPKSFAVKIGDGDYSNSYRKCMTIIREIINIDRCKNCFYKDVEFNLSCSNCIHSIKEDDLQCSLIKNKYDITLNNSKNTVVCKNYSPINNNNWLGYSNYLLSMKNCYCNPNCGYIKTHNLNGLKNDDVIPLYINVNVKNLYYMGRLVESVWIPKDKWVNQTFIDDEKIYTSYIKFKKIKGSNLDFSYLMYIKSIDYKPNENSLKKRLSFIRSVKLNNNTDLPFD